MPLWQTSTGVSWSHDSFNNHTVKSTQRNTTIIEKAVPSLINTGFVFFILSPFIVFYGFTLGIRCALVCLFLLVQIVDTHTRSQFRCIGMRALGSYWAHNYSSRQKLLYSILYSASFATLVFYVYIPLDIFVVNMLLVQLPCIMLTGTTLHGFLAGNMQSVIKKS